MASEKRFRNPLNVVVEKVGTTRAMVHGDVSVESLKELLMSSLSLLPDNKLKNDDDEGKRMKKSGPDILKKDSNDPAESSHGENETKTSAVNEKKVIESLDASKREFGASKKTFAASVKAKSKIVKNKKKKKEVGKKDKISEIMFDGRDSKSRGSYDQEKIEAEALESLKSCSSSFSIDKSPFSNNGRWLREHFEKPLVLGLRDLIKNKPSDPVGYLAFWLRIYRSNEESNKRKMDFENELKMKRLLIRNQESGEILESGAGEYHSDQNEEGGGRADWNFKNYYPGIELN